MNLDHPHAALTSDFLSSGYAPISEQLNHSCSRNSQSPRSFSRIDQHFYTYCLLNSFACLSIRLAVCL